VFEIVFFLLMLAFAGLCYYGGYRQGRQHTKVGTPSASHKKPSVPCDKCGPHGVIDQYHWNFCCKCGRKLHTAHVG
jgi:hypothetical protein